VGQLAEPDVKLPGTIEDLRGLAKRRAMFFMDHDDEPDAVDMLEESKVINEIVRLVVDESTYGRVCQYMRFIRLSFSKPTYNPSYVPRELPPL
jgi:hypothetical protein